MFGSSFHFGLDISLNTGDSVRSALDGVVRIVRKDPPGYGNFVVVTHMNGLETLYGHLDKPLVREGQHVKSGEAIGLGGNTGRSSGPHLHFEFRFMGEPIDPLRIISLKNGKPIHNSFVLDKTFFDHLRKLRGMAVLKTRNGGSLHGVGCDEVVPVSGELIERYYAACSCPNAHGAESEYLTELELEQIKYGILEPESLID
jgi:hypothetical protein